MQINAKIVAVEVVTATPTLPEVVASPILSSVHEKVKRPKALQGKTYQLKTPLSEHTWYITLNDIVLNEGTEYETVQPFEIFINTKDVSSFQWTIFASRMLSALFRKGGDIKFILDEMASVYQPNGGYLTKKGYMPSLVAEIGKVIEQHYHSIGLFLHDPVTTAETTAPRCPKCGATAYYIAEGCATCMECGYSKCS